MHIIYIFIIFHYLCNEINPNKTRTMNKALAFILGMLGLGASTACSQHAFEDADVLAFAELIQNPDVQLLDVRTAEEFAEGHLSGAMNIDVKKSSFMDEARVRLDKARKVAVYCRSGRRSANAATMLTDEGYQVVNMKGGIVEWQAKRRPVTKDMAEVDAFLTKSGKVVRLHALIHASIRIEYDGKEIEIDPVGKLGNRTVDVASLPKADYIFVTHEHGDHFDKAALQQLSSAQTQFITNQRCAEMAGYGQAIKNGDSLSLQNDIKVEAIPAYNTTEGHTQFHPKGRDNGYILTIDGLRIYIAGDTEDIPEMADVKDIDIAFLPCNQPYTMTPEQLVRAAKVVKPRVLFPYHYGQTNVSQVPEQLKAEGIDVRIRHYE